MFRRGVRESIRFFAAHSARRPPEPSGADRTPPAFGGKPGPSPLIRLSLPVPIAIANPRASRIHSIVKDSRLLRCGAEAAELDKAGGDMVHFRVNLRPPKENEAARIII